MAPRFGTSGLRGLVADLTPDLVSAHVRAFLGACPHGSGLYLGRDLRPSSPRLAGVVAEAARRAGIPVTDCGAVPTPALALAAMRAGAAAVMVTGSHIPADRNGLKFYTPAGEITKLEETAILAALGDPPPPAPGPAPLLAESGVGEAWIRRIVTAFGTEALAGLRIGVWSHSAVSRDLLIAALRALGCAAVTELGRSGTFVPVDTEAVPDQVRAQITAWVREHGLDALVSTDGDGDRPLLADAEGRIIPGDLLGQITAALVGAVTVVTPVSSNSGVEAEGRFAQVIRTRIGSPFVLAAMEEAGGRCVGYEANGGFLLGFEAQLAGSLPKLMTRDSLLPLVAPLSLARAAGGLAALVAREPARFTATDRLEEVPRERAQALVADLSARPERLAGLLAGLGEAAASLDRTDGLRIRCVSGRILHLRPSGNAPELRLYVEADAPEAARDLLARGLHALGAALEDWAPSSPDANREGTERMQVKWH
ncbi:phosphomannomutase [Cereibacter sphaeroides]|uniref:phosphomannomutase n=1 Tax=Cereibacter sphaeroides TaxID=1063 RepID=UPI001F1F7AEE|nr:phosphomannomutase [Cereibacter sphaeroides]MCE6958711.1 phosphomannomutase [Cereibacter sphaeroides]MCE6973406.1 phosphomannomutase [Cereibacter sphaeroides]